jgi:hypothetical protein
VTTRRDKRIAAGLMTTLGVTVCALILATEKLTTQDKWITLFSTIVSCVFMYFLITKDPD